MVICGGMSDGISLGIFDGISLGITDGICLGTTDGRYRNAFFPAEESMHHDLNESKLTRSIGWRWSFRNRALDLEPRLF